MTQQDHFQNNIQYNLTIKKKRHRGWHYSWDRNIKMFNMKRRESKKKKVYTGQGNILQEKQGSRMRWQVSACMWQRSTCKIPLKNVPYVALASVIKPSAPTVYWKPKELLQSWTLTVLLIVGSRFSQIRYFNILWTGHQHFDRIQTQSKYYFFSNIKIINLYIWGEQIKSDNLPFLSSTCNSPTKPTEPTQILWCCYTVRLVLIAEMYL